jgi:tetratricopeptide (TPR) repeat protein
MATLATAALRRGSRQIPAGGHADTAEPAFQRAIDLEPNYPASLNGLGQLYLSKNQLDKAEQYLLKAAPSAPAAWWGLGKIYLLQGKWADAAKYLQQIVDSGQAQGADLETVKMMLDAAHNQNLPDSLRKQISPAYSGSPVAENVRQGWVAMNQGDTLKARQLFEQALEDNPDDSNALNGMGWLLLRTGNPDDAKAKFQAAMKNDPNAAGAMNGLAIVDRQQGDLDDAIAIWEQMVQKYPGVNAGTYGLANAYMTKKKYDKAEALYEQIVAANPDDADAKAQLEKAKSAAGAGN